MAGRLLPGREGGWLLRDDSGEARLDAADDSLRSGSWVELRVEVHGARLRLLEIEGQGPGPERSVFASSLDFARQRRRRQQRDALLRSLRGGFAARGFVEVETPVLLDAPGQEPHLEPFRTEWCGRALWLATSPEYAMKRLLVEGADRLFQLGRSFRGGRDESSTWHQPEFSLLEWYRAFADLESLRRDLHGMLEQGSRAVNGGTVVERAGRYCDLAVEPRWMTVREAFAEFAQVDLEPYLDEDHAAFLRSLGLDPAREEDLAAAAEREFGRRMVDRIEPRLGFGEPVLLCDYPARHAALAECRADDPRVAARFELYVLGIELANAFQELRDPVEQERRLRAENRQRREDGGDQLPVDEVFLEALRRGLPPAAGIALGVDRLLALLAGASGLDEVVCQPRSIESGP